MTLFVYKYKYNSHIYLHVYELPDHATSAHANVVIILKIKKKHAVQREKHAIWQYDGWCEPFPCCEKCKHKLLR